MRSSIQLAVLLGCGALVACSHTDSDTSAGEMAPVRPKPRAWVHNGLVIPIHGRSADDEELVGPDASLAGPGLLEEAVAAAPAEPLPTGAGAPTLEGGMLNDTPPATEPQSPYDPALKSPPGDPAAPAAPGTPATGPTPPETPKVETPKEEPKPAGEPKPAAAGAPKEEKPKSSGAGPTPPAGQ